MGLDMYLTAKKYLSTYDVEDKKIQTVLKKAFQTEFLPNEVAFEAGYWRKANHIHNWFVQNVQNGDDDCKEYWVDKSKLEELKEECDTILAAVGQESFAEIAAESLPASEGFFFGGVDYDEYYIEQTRYTSELIGRLLNNPQLKDMNFYYRSSW